VRHRVRWCECGGSAAIGKTRGCGWEGGTGQAGVIIRGCDDDDDDDQVIHPDGLAERMSRAADLWGEGGGAEERGLFMTELLELFDVDSLPR
jgi:hypothetical protein